MNHFDSDYNKVLHSEAFRKLGHKQQLHLPLESSIVRNRLTHSLEVAAIAESILFNVLDKDIAIDLLDATKAAALMHDIGHPPFGHTGESALNSIMINFGGFNGNAQNIRLMTTLNKTGWVSVDTLLGILKNPIAYSDAINSKAILSEVRHMKDNTIVKCYYDEEQGVVDKLLYLYHDSDKELFTSYKEYEDKHAKSSYKSFIASVISIADSIAYGVFDIEDHYKLGIEISEDKVTSSSSIVENCIISTKLTKLNKFQSLLLDYQVYLESRMCEHLNYLKKISYEDVILGRDKCISDSKHYHIIHFLFDRIKENPLGLLEGDRLDDYNKATNNQQRMRAICDYIAYMSDLEAINLYSKLK